MNASPSNPAPVAVDNAGISDENDFGAVSGRQSIESDKARIAANRAQYAIVQPTALPSRAGGSQPNVVAYALETKHPLGTQVHRRRGFATAAKTQRNCAVYNSADDAQLRIPDTWRPRLRIALRWTLMVTVMPAVGTLQNIASDRANRLFKLWSTT